MIDDTAFEVTRDWIHRHKTERGGFTKAQVQALGVDYPPKKGWVSELCGEYITQDQAKAFMDGKGHFSPVKTMKVTRILASMKTMERDQLLMIESQLKKQLGS